MERSEQWLEAHEHMTLTRASKLRDSHPAAAADSVENFRVIGLTGLRIR